MTTADNINTDFLPLVYDIMRGIEKDTCETAQKTTESVDSSQKILELRNKLQQCREEIQKLPGIDYTKEDQIKKLETLREQLVQKRQLLMKYKNLCHFDIPKI